MLWLWIIGILLLLFLLVCRTRLGIRAAFGGETATADLTVGPFHFRVAPGKPQAPKKAKEKPPKTKKTPKDLSDTAKKFPKPTLEDLRDAYRTLAPACKRALRRTRRSIRVHPLTLSVTLAGEEDPAGAAELYGRLHAAVWTVMPVLEQLLVIPDPRVHIGVDFEAGTVKAQGEFGVSIRIGTLMAVGLGMGVPALKWFLRLRKQHQTKPPASPPAEAARQPAA